MGILIPRQSAVRGLFIGILFTGIFVVVNVFLFSRYNMWLNLIYPVLTMLAVYLAMYVVLLGAVLNAQLIAMRRDQALVN